MAIIKRKIENLKPGKEYLVTVRSKNMDINTSAELAESIRFTVPEDDTQPSAITNLALYQSLQNVMFVFDFVNDADIARYEYELYNGNTTSSNLISTGFNDANVFTVSVENLYNNSGSGTGLIPFWGRVRAIDTSGNNGLWTSLVQTSGDVPLIDSQYIGSLTASKITAGTIGAQTIQLNGANSILKSSGYTSGSAGWIIKGDGSAEFRNVTIGGTSSIEGLPDLADITEVLNFNDRNDRNSLVPNAPGIPTGGNAIDHTMNTDGSCNISFEWTYSNDLNPAGQNNIDGFIVYVYDAPETPAPTGSYTFGTDITKELTFPLDADRRAFILYSAPANHYYTFGVKAYRVVDDDIATPAILYSAMARSAVSGEDPYRPSVNVPFAGDVTGTVDGMAAGTVRGAAFNFNANNDRISTVPATVDAAPVITAVQNLDASVDLTVSWAFTGTGNAYNIDGFVIYFKTTATSGGSITTSDLNTNIQQVYVTAEKRSHTFSGFSPEKFYRVAIGAFRIVDTDINAGGILFGPLTNSSERASGTPIIGGNTGISIGSGKIFIGTGIYGTTGTGFYVDSAGQFSLKDQLTWNGTTLTVVGAVTATSGTFTGTVNANAGNFTGSITIGGNIRSGQTAYNTGTGFWLGVDGVTPKFSIGNSSGNSMTWDGSTLNIVGTITGALTGTITSNATITGGNIVGGAIYSPTSTGANRVEIASGQIRLYTDNTIFGTTAPGVIQFNTATTSNSGSILSTGGLYLASYNRGGIMMMFDEIEFSTGTGGSSSSAFTIGVTTNRSFKPLTVDSTITSGGVMEVNGLGIRFTGANRIGTNNQMGLRWTAGFASVLGTIDNVADCVLGTVSDIRLKTDIRTLDDPVLPKLRELRPVKYYPLDLNGTVVDGAKELIGLIAQEVSHVYPHLVPGYDPDDLERYISVDYAKLTPLLIKAIRELEDKILEIESKI